MKALTSQTSQAHSSSQTFAFAYLGALSSGIVSEEMSARVENWLQSLEPHEINVWDLLVLTGIMRFSPDKKIQLFYLLAWNKLVGVQIPKSLERLPNSFLKNQDRRYRALHAAIFLPDQKSRNYSLSLMFQDMVIENRDLLFIGTAIFLMFFPYGRQFLAGSAVGLFLIASFNESMAHRLVGHTSPRTEKLFQKLGAVGRLLQIISQAHQLHHFKVSREFCYRFKSEEFRRQFEKVAETKYQRLGVKIKAQNPSQKGAELYQIFLDRGYGVHGTNTGSTLMLIGAIPWLAIAYFIGAYFKAPVFAMSAFVVGNFFVLQSLYSHRYLHMNREEILSNGHTTWLMRWYMTTRPAQFQQRLHFVHHQYHHLEAWNDVIMVGSGVDWIRRMVKAPNCQDLAKMDAQEFLDYT
ncbi:MAG: hypothetical protein V4598_01780 [Bdellovibrionota bacterium]